jgi:hypothetical protein
MKISRLGCRDYDTLPRQFIGHLFADAEVVGDDAGRIGREPSGNVDFLLISNMLTHGLTSSLVLRSLRGALDRYGHPFM